MSLQAARRVLLERFSAADRPVVLKPTEEV